MLGATAAPRTAYRQARMAGQATTAELDSQKSGPDGLEPYRAVATSAAKGVGSIMAAGLKTPVTFTNGLARGFHNAPRLYGDDTVRDEDKISGWKSGFAAAGKVRIIYL